MITGLASLETLHGLMNPYSNILRDMKSMKGLGKIRRKVIMAQKGK
jgi:hypothetical protein